MQVSSKTWVAIIVGTGHLSVYLIMQACRIQQLSCCGENENDDPQSFSCYSNTYLLPLLTASRLLIRSAVR